jgi:cell division septation protein DedD
MTVNRSFDEDDLRASYVDRHPDHSGDDREISLGMPTILGIFFALALALAAVFGLGYSLGRKSTQTAAVYTDPTLASSSAAKPSAGTADQPPAPVAQPVADTTPTTQTATVPLPPATPNKNSVTSADSIAVGDKPIVPQSTTNNLQPATSFVVQIAAVSTQDVADILTSSLAKKGYTVAVRHEPQDKLLHVQIGPFADRKDADAMRARVLADGFNAIVK